MEEMKNMTLKTFIDELASNSPAPGGGSAAGLSASLASALAAMVLNLTVGRKMYNEYDEEVKREIDGALSKAEALKDEFLRLMDEDTAVFNEVMAAFKLPKETEEEKQRRSESIQKSYIGAMHVPLKIAKKAVEIFNILEIAAKHGNPNAVSDAGVGTLLALTGLESAILNVKINLSAIKDKGIVEMASGECRELLALAAEKKSHIMEIVEGKL